METSEAHVAQSHASGRRARPAAVFAATAGVLLLLDAVLWVLLLGIQQGSPALAQTVFPSLLLLSGLAALCAARIVRAAPRWAALLCAAAIVPVTVIHLVPPLVYLRTPPPSFAPQVMGLGAFTPLLVTWLVIVTPLAVSIALASLACASTTTPPRAARHAPGAGGPSQSSHW